LVAAIILEQNSSLDALNVRTTRKSFQSILRRMFLNAGFVTIQEEAYAGY
jgi:hypothetical protein